MPRTALARPLKKGTGTSRQPDNCWNPARSLRASPLFQPAIHRARRMPILESTATELLAEMDAGRVSSVELTRAYLDQIERHDGR